MNCANMVNWRYTMLNIKEIMGAVRVLFNGQFQSGLYAASPPQSQRTKASADFPLLYRSFSAVSPLFNIKTTKHQYE